jgi:hypothetical protein
MGFETDADYQGITYMPFADSRALAAGATHVYGSGVNADEDPGNVLASLEVRNTGTVVLRVGFTKVGVRNLDEYFDVPAGEAVAYPSPVSRLALYNPHGSTAGAFSVMARMGRTPTASHPGHGVDLTADNDQLTADADTVTADATEYC